MSAFSSRSARTAAASKAEVVCVDEDECEEATLGVTRTGSRSGSPGPALQPVSRPTSAAPVAAGRRKPASSRQQEVVVEENSDEEPGAHRVASSSGRSSSNKAPPPAAAASATDAWSIPARSSWTQEPPAAASTAPAAGRVGTRPASRSGWGDPSPTPPASTAAVSHRGVTSPVTSSSTGAFGYTSSSTTSSANASGGSRLRGRSTGGGPLAEEEVEDSSLTHLSSAVAATHLASPGVPPAAPAAGSAAGVTTAASVTPLSLDLERSLDQMLWGAATRPGSSWPAPWMQGLEFSASPGLWWGLVQHQGGPCGVLAAIQGHLMAVLLEQGLLGEEALPPQQLQQQLVAALSTMLWTARSGATAALVAPATASIRAAPSSTTNSSSSGGGLQVYTAASQQQLQGLLQATAGAWRGPSQQGLRLLLYSLLLTHTPAAVKGDMDLPDTPLIAAHGYCSMELVNLCLTGQAVSNVFDGVRQLDEAMTLHGVATKSRVGLLTLFEWYRYVEVGTHLKCPQLPVWVVCSESHFSTLWLPQQHKGQQRQQQREVGQGQLQRPFVLHYYDGLARQEGPILLHVAAAAGAAGGVAAPQGTISKSSSSSQGSTQGSKGIKGSSSSGSGGGWTTKLAGVAEERGTWEGAPIPPLECVIETKWPDSCVTWEGSEPLL